MYKVELSKHRFPLIVAIVAWLSIQLLVQRSDIFERVFTFLTPVYAILIAVGLIALVRFITRYRIARFYIAITLSVMMCVPITYQLISQQILPHTWITGYMPNADGIAQSIQDLLKPEDYILSQFTTGKILEYYFWRNKSDIQVEIGSLLDEAYVMEWQLGGTRYVVDKPNITLSSLMLQWNNIATEDMFTFQPMTELSDNLFLYSLTIPPNLPVISNIDDVEKYWFVNNQHVSYQLDNEGVLTFDMFGDQWKLFRYRHGRYFHDYRLSMRVKIIEISDDFEDLLIHFRENDESYYSLAVKANDESGNGFLGLRLDVDGLFQGYFSTTIAQVNTNQWIDITIDIKGNTFTAYLNDEQVLQGDDSLLGSGTISFIAPYDSKVQVSNVRID